MATDNWHCPRLQYLNTGDAGRRKTHAPSVDRLGLEWRKIAAAREPKRFPMRLNRGVFRLFCRSCIALSGGRQIEVEAALPVSVDDEENDAASPACEALSVHASVGCAGNLRIKHRRAHQPVPHHVRPVVGAGLEGVLVESAVVARRQCVVHDDCHASTCQTGMLDQIAKGIEEDGVPGVAPASFIRRFVIHRGLPGSKRSRRLTSYWLIFSGRESHSGESAAAAVVWNFSRMFAHRSDAAAYQW